MTLDEYIADLVRLRDHYNAGDFEVMTDKVSLGITKHHGHYTMHNEMVPMDGDDFCLDLENKVCEVHAKIVKYGKE